MRIITWNINGLTAALRKGFLRHINGFNADVICVQEVRSDIPLNLPGYQQYWNLATRKGYSGTLLLTKSLPLSVKYGFDNERFDCEGRVITADLGSCYIVNVYVPNFNTNSDESRREYRYSFDKAFREYIYTLQKPVIIAGDFNVAHQHRVRCLRDRFSCPFDAFRFFCCHQTKIPDRLRDRFNFAKRDACESINNFLKPDLF